MRIELTNTQIDLLRIAASTVSDQGNFAALVLALLDRRGQHRPSNTDLNNAIRLTLDVVPHVLARN